MTIEEANQPFMQQTNQITIGDRVRFEARGSVITGVVTGSKASKPGARNALVRLGRIAPIRVRKFEVKPDEGGGLWTVAEHSCTKIGRAQEHKAVAARTKALVMKSFVKQQRSKRVSENLDIVSQRGLFDLQRGDTIEVEFKGGHKMKCCFEKLTGSGMIGFYREGDKKFDALGLSEENRVRFTAPEFVSKV